MIWRIVGLELKRHKPRLSKINPKNIFQVAIIFLFVAFLVSMMGFIIYVLTNTFVRLRLGEVYLKFIFLILFVVLVVYETANIIVVLYINKDQEIFAKLPVKRESVFIAKLIYIYLKQLFITIIFLSITAGVYGLVSPQLGFIYYIRLLLLALIFPILPLSVASLLSIPMSYLMRYLRKNRQLLVVSLIVILGLLFTLYISFVQLIMQFIDLSQQGGQYIPPELIQRITDSVRYLFISGIFYQILMNQKFLLNTLILTVILAALLASSYYILKHMYNKALLMQTDHSIYNKKMNRLKENKPFMSIVKKEVKLMIRNPNYAFQAIIINILMPIFVYLTVKLTNQVGLEAVGNKIVVGVALLTIMIFIILSNSFQGNMISREKEAFYISKIIPVNRLYHLLGRMVAGFTISLVVLLVTIGVLFVTDFVTIFESFVLLVISVLFLIGYTFFSVANDYKNPQLSSYSGGIEEGLNMFVTMFVGLMLGVILGVSLSVFPFFPNLISLNLLYILIVSVIIIYTLCAAAKLFFVVKKA